MTHPFPTLRSSDLQNKPAGTGTMFLICSISDSPGRRTTMADALMFYTNPMSRGQIVRWMLEEVGAPYEPRLLDYGTTMKAGDYLAINPMRSEEHTSELQSLMRNSYAFYCLK